VVHGYPSTLDAIAATLTGEDRERLALRFVSCAGETLFPEARRRIEEGFGARLFDIYGTHESNVVAVECAATGRLHVVEEAILVEVLRSDGRPALEGEEGEVVITPLHSYAMPFLRFRLGDLAVRGPTPCPCGAPVATLERVTGRTIELFVLPDDRRIHPYHILMPMLENAPWIRQFRIVQEETREISISVVPTAMPSAESRAAAVRAIEAALGGGVRVEIVMVERIDAAPGKKLNPYVCRVVS
jgi:phenylacetate-CoA ligase